jgi:hypothetical protein
LATGLGSAGRFENTNASNGSNALFVSAAGAGNAVSAVNTGSGPAGMFVRTSTAGGTTLLVTTAGGKALEAKGGSTGIAGFFENSATNIRSAVEAIHNGRGNAAAFFTPNTANPAATLFARTDGSGWTATFEARSLDSKGVLITTRGGAGLQVIGGTKNAVVGTTTGARALYTEESSEVWFTDYGFASLKGGHARVLLEPTFAQTVSLEEPYHVFVQPYGRAELYVDETTSLGFVVRLKDGDADAKFGYRIVAKRKGFEKTRLEHAPWADESTP